MVKRLRHTVKLATLATLCLMAQPLVGTADANDIRCGSVITSDTKLTHNITCPGDGLIFGADNITLDLGGFVLAGSGRRTGVDTSGHSGVVVTNGIVKSFGTGIWVGGPDGAVEAGGSGNTVRGLTTKNNSTNVYLYGTANTRVTDSKMVGGGNYGLKIIRGTSISALNNKIYNTAGVGIWNDFGGGHLIQGNRITYNGGDGIKSIPSLTILDNTISHNGGSGIYQYPHGQTARSAMTISRNLICNNGLSGIAMTAEGHSITDNNVGVGTEGCLPNGRARGYDLYDGAAAELPISDIVCPSTWRNNYTEGDTFNHPCVTR